MLLKLKCLCLDIQNSCGFCRPVNNDRCYGPKWDQAGIKNGQYTRITANYSSTLDSGIEMSGVLAVVSRDCQGADKTTVLLTIIL